MSVVSNSVPPYLIDWADPGRSSFANTLVPTSATYQIPKTTVFNDPPIQATVVGGVGVAVNGMQISSPSASGGMLKYADPAAIEVDGDLCHGHPNPAGKYHQHAMAASCVFPDAEDGTSEGSPCTAPSPLIGWIADGYPMYGPCECLDEDCAQVVEMKSSWSLAGGDGDVSDCAHQDYTYVGAADEESDGDAYLDECSGHYGPGGDYHYHMTNAYPWTLRCYRGTPRTTSTAGRVYNAASGQSDCCFEAQCDGGNYNGSSCTTATCVGTIAAAAPGAADGGCAASDGAGGGLAGLLLGLGALARRRRAQSEFCGAGSSSAAVAGGRGAGGFASKTGPIGGASSFQRGRKQVGRPGSADA
jgi:uncharacterized protein (TIGR03382 family)